MHWFSTPPNDFMEVFIGPFHEHTFVMGTGGQAALNGCVNTRDGSQVAAMSGPTLDRVCGRGWLCATLTERSCSFSHSTAARCVFNDMKLQ